MTVFRNNSDSLQNFVVKLYLLDRESTFTNYAAGSIFTFKRQMEVGFARASEL